MSYDLATLRIGFIGAGQMATALARGFLSGGVLSADRLVASDAYPAAAERFQSVTSAGIARDNQDVCAQSDVIILAVKPQQMASVLADIQSAIVTRQLIVSIAAGIPLKTLEAGLGTSARVIRVMPNTPCLIGDGASAFALGTKATADDGALVQTLLNTVGISSPVNETLLDAVTGLSGSGPAFAYLMIEALSDGGVRAGLPRDLATRFAAQTLLGAARMVLETHQHPGALKDAVTSPGGTTIAGLQAMENAGIRGGLMNAVVAATERSRQLSQG